MLILAKIAEIILLLFTLNKHLNDYATEKKMSNTCTSPHVLAVADFS